MIVCRDAQAGAELRHCLTEALTALEPDSIHEVRYSPPRDNLWVQFGDGFSSAVEWSSLGIDDLRDAFVAESASVGEGGKTIALMTTDGDLLEIDSASIRGVLDDDFRTALQQEAADSDEVVGTRLREAREGAGLTQVELSGRTGIDQAVISRLERGKHRPRIDTLRRIASALDMTVPQLLTSDRRSVLGEDVPG
jgi:DNA-binding XRE family transcriptional regulator